MDEMSSESNIIRTYLEWVASMPFGILTPEHYDLK
jgi:ATP-dependent Lon protease